jgi:glutaconyl-CoA/methylmalonyl-CoA decarboxylase subunit gamma
MERKFRITVDGRPYNVTVEELTELNGPHAETGLTFMPSQITPALAPLNSVRAPAYQAPAAVNHGPAGAGDVVAPLGGVVESVLVTIGQEVGEGERVLVIEAMKMKTPITSTRAGKVEAVLVKAGDGVETGQVLVKLAGS